MRDLTNMEMDMVSGGLVSVSTGDVNVGNGISAGNKNSILSDNCVDVSDNGNGNLSKNDVDVKATVVAILGGLL